LKEVKKILAQDPILDLELPTSDGNTALMVACSAGAVDIAREYVWFPFRVVSKVLIRKVCNNPCVFLFAG